MKGEMREGAGRRQAEEPERWPEASTGEKGQRLWRKVMTACGFNVNLSGLLSEIVRKFSYTNRSSGEWSVLWKSRKSQLSALRHPGPLVVCMRTWVPMAERGGL